MSHIGPQKKKSKRSQVMGASKEINAAFAKIKDRYGLPKSKLYLENKKRIETMNRIRKIESDGTDLW